ncbi:MAG: sulfotransferase family 2 domain-containing protein [Bacillota bacterium]
MNKNKDNLLIFLHIPKTAGTSLRKIVERQYRLNEIVSFYGYESLENQLSKYSRENLRRKKCVLGHFRYGIHSHFSKPYTYITMLRDPIESLISLYYFVHQNPNLPMYEQVKNKTFEEFISNENVHNRLTWYLAGEGPSNLQKAIENLKDFHFVGITEMFDESVFLMKKKFGWNNVNYEKLNVTKNRPKSKQIPNHVIEKVMEKNHLDIELYQYVKNSLKKEINALGLESNKEFKAFKALMQKS